MEQDYLVFVTYSMLLLLAVFLELYRPSKYLRVGIIVGIGFTFTLTFSIFLNLFVGGVL